MAERPQSPTDTGSSWNHNLRAKEGNFHSLVWKCVDCERVRVKKQFYKDVPCEGEEADDDDDD